MMTNTPRDTKRQRRTRTGHAWPATAMLALVVLIGALATPASALGGEAVTRQGRAPASGGSDNTSSAPQKSGDLNVAMLLAMAGLGLAIAAPVACRAGIGQWLSVRRFQNQLRRADVVTLCRQLGPNDAGARGEEPSLPE